MPGANDATGSFCGGGGRKRPGADTDPIVNLEAVPVTRVPYVAAGWGVGELWLEGTRLVWHELPHHPHPGRGSDPPPSRSTLPANPSRERNGTVPEVEQLVHRLTAYF